MVELRQTQDKNLDLSENIQESSVEPIAQIQRTARTWKKLH